MYKIGLISLFVSILFIFDARAYNWSKCKKNYKNPYNFVGLGFTSTTSSAQWTSSWGACSMLGQIEKHKNKVFLVDNLGHLKDDTAKGSGEYLAAFTTLSACDEMSSKKLTKLLRANYSQVFGDDLGKSPREAYEGINELVKKDRAISCQYLGS